MFGSKNAYDRGVNTFSPEGRLLQVEYALESIKLGASALAIKTKEGVVLAAEKRLQSCLQVTQSVEKIFELDSCIACVSAGLNADAKTLVDIARVESQNHRFVYNEGLKVQALCQCISDQMLNFGEGDPSNRRKPMARPYGVALLVAGCDEDGPVLFHTDPSGTMIEYQAKGIGAADEGLQSLLLEQYKKDLTLEQGERLALNCLKQVMEEKITKENVELCVIPMSTKKFTPRNEQHIANIISSLN